jgi:SAM-dependent methyltransferase
MKMLKIEKLLVNSRWSRKRVLKLAKKLLDFVETGSETDFLEVGCGNGEVVRYLDRNYCGSVTGVDVDPEQIAIARKGADNTPNIRFFEADATRLPFEDGSFDVVLSFGVLHHIDNWLGALKEIKRVLRGGGYFVYADLIYPEAITRMDSSSEYGFGLVTINVDELSSFIRQSGFSTIHSELTKSFVCRNYEAVYRRD